MEARRSRGPRRADERRRTEADLWMRISAGSPAAGSLGTWSLGPSAGDLTH